MPRALNFASDRWHLDRHSVDESRAIGSIVDTSATATSTQGTTGSYDLGRATSGAAPSGDGSGAPTSKTVQLSGIPSSMNREIVFDLLQQFGGPLQTLNLAQKAIDCIDLTHDLPLPTRKRSEQDNSEHLGHGTAEYVDGASALEAVSFSPLLGFIEVKLSATATEHAVHRHHRRHHHQTCRRRLHSLLPRRPRRQLQTLLQRDMQRPKVDKQPIPAAKRQRRSRFDPTPEDETNSGLGPFEVEQCQTFQFPHSLAVLYRALRETYDDVEVVEGESLSVCDCVRVNLCNGVLTIVWQASPMNDLVADSVDFTAVELAWAPSVVKAFQGSEETDSAEARIFRAVCAYLRQVYEEYKLHPLWSKDLKMPQLRQTMTKGRLTAGSETSGGEEDAQFDSEGRRPLATPQQLGTGTALSTTQASPSPAGVRRISTPGSAVRSNGCEETCEICCEDFPKNKAFRLSCGHGFYCYSCVTLHAEARLQNGHATVPCPDCNVNLPDHVLAQLLPKTLIESLQARSLEQAVSSVADLWACPTPDCPMRVALEENDPISRLKCPKCNKESCLRCGAQPYHKGLTCEEHAERARAKMAAKGKRQRHERERFENDLSFMKWIKNTGTKQCPQCKIAVSKQNLDNQATQYSECHKMVCRS